LGTIERGFGIFDYSGKGLKGSRVANAQPDMKKVIVLHSNAVLIKFNINWLWQLGSTGSAQLV
tara:strand:+ start:822 stop:1010 length:189 start_codon:yes stop_codon:yes gene_type:complete